jgi:ribosomal protein L6P/L9E
MRFVSKRCIIKIPSEILVFYCEKKNLLILKNKKKQKLLKLKVKIFLLNNKSSVLVTNQSFNKFSNKQRKSLQGFTVSLIKKSISEISSVTYKKLALVGVGYKAFDASLPSKNLEFLNLKLGYSHSIYYKIPNTVSIKVLQSTKLFISGFDLNAVYKTAALVRGCKPPEPYKGKGILYSGEKVILKEGKKV